MDLSRQQLRHLARLERELSRMSHRLTPAGYTDRHSARWTLKLADLRDQLARLAAIDGGVEPMVAHAQLLQARLVTLITERGSLGARAGLGSQTVPRINDAAAQLDALEAELQGVGQLNSGAMNRWLRQLAAIERAITVLPQNNHVITGLRQRCWAFADRIEALSGANHHLTEETITFDGDFQICA